MVKFIKRCACRLFAVCVLVTSGILIGVTVFDRDERLVMRLATFGFTRVTKVRDGDTICIAPYWLKQRCIRLIGVDTPESVKPGQGVECYGKDASDFMKSQVEHSWVLLNFDSRTGLYDKYHRLLAYVWLWDGEFLNKKLITEGYAEETGYGHTYQYQSEFQRAEKSAMDEGRGRWSACGIEKKHPVKH